MFVSIPLKLEELTLWLAIVSVMLLITSELLSSHYGKIQILVNKKKLRNVAFGTSLITLMLIMVRVINIILG